MVINYIYFVTLCFYDSNYTYVVVLERKLRVCENMVLRRIFGPRRDEVTGDWR